MDAGEESEEGLCHMDLVFTDVTCTPVEGDRRTFQVTLALQAQGVLRREVTAPILTDLYSTTHTLETTEAMYPHLPPAGPGRGPGERPGDGGDQQRAQPSPGRPGAPGPPDPEPGRGEDRVLTQEAELSVLYETEEGPAAASRRVSLSHRLPGQGRGPAW